MLITGVWGRGLAANVLRYCGYARSVGQQQEAKAAAQAAFDSTAPGAAAAERKTCYSVECDVTMESSVEAMLSYV